MKHATAKADVDGPAIALPGHRRDRNLTAIAGGPIAWRNASQHPLFVALEAQKISADEYAAGEFYRALFEKIGRSGRDSTQFAVIGTGGAVPFTDSQVTAILWLKAIEERIPPDRCNWVLFIRAFCGEGWSARESCRKINRSDPRFIWMTTRLALTKLSTAIAGTKAPLRRTEP